MTEYSFSISLTPRYRDIDPNGHVNHAVYATYFEEARTAYWEAVVDEPLAEAGVALVSQQIEYERELRLGDKITVLMRVDELGDASIPMRYELRRAGRSVATGSVVMVAFDRTERRSRRIPERWRSAIRTYEAAHDTAWAIDNASS